MPTITTKELTTLKIAKRYYHTVKSRLAIVHYATDHGIKGAARRFGLDRKTVRAWRRRWQAAGVAGLVPRYPPHPGTPHCGLDRGVDRARPPRPPLRGGPHSHLARARPSDPRRGRDDSPHLPPPRLPPARPPQRRPRQLTLFSRDQPGDCVQVDVKEVKVAGTKCFQYTAIDDGTRYRILRLYPQKNQQTSHSFFTTLHTTLPFPIRKLQVDNGTEFPLAFALTVQQAGMRLRYIKPRCPEQMAKWNAVIGSMRKNSGAAPVSRASRRQPTPCPRDGSHGKRPGNVTW